MISITERFQSLLENLFINSLSQKDHQQLLHTLETYCLVCCQSSAEELFRNTFVRPYMEQVKLPWLQTAIKLFVVFLGHFYKVYLDTPTRC